MCHPFWIAHALVNGDKEGIADCIHQVDTIKMGADENQFPDGSLEFYLTEPRAVNDPKRVGPLMMVAVLAGRLTGSVIDKMH